MTPHLRAPRWPDSIPASRFASRVARAASIRELGPGDVALVGLPDDLGVRLNHGRPGAAEGPNAFRDALARYAVASPDGFAWPRVVDVGDVEPAPGNAINALRETHDRITGVVAEVLATGATPCCVGGGHDLSFASARALAGSFGVVYFDAHLDVRAEPGSGMPFRALVEHRAVGELHALGIDPLANAEEHASWFRAHGGRVHDPSTPARATLTESISPRAQRLFASFDLDVIDAAFAPGVSAMNPCGWSPAEAARWVEACGRDPRVALFDLMELSPPNDHAGRTARLAAHLFLRFLRGHASRAVP